MRLLSSIFALVLSSISAEAAIYYIDYASGSDANAGTSTSLPWKHCPGDSRATSNAAITAAAGDIFIFKGDVVYQLAAAADKIAVNANGSSGSPIVFDGDSGTFAARWGTGSSKAVIDGNDTANYALWAPTRSWITINNFEMRNSGYGGSFVSFTTSASHCILSNSYLHDRYDWDLESGPNKTGPYMQSCGRGVSIDGTSSYILVDNVEITKVGGCGIGIGGFATEITVQNSYIHDYIVWFIDISTYGNEALSNIYIKDNVFKNLYHYSQKYWRGTITDEKLNYSSVENPHEDGIFVRQPESTGAIQNLQIFNNRFFNDIDPTEDGGTAWLYTSKLRAGTSVYIYNNQFQSPYPNDTIALGWNESNGYGVYVYHNTFALKHGNGIQITEFMAAPTHTFSFMNNLFLFHSGSGGAAFQPMTHDAGTCSSVLGAITSDYNFFDLGSNARISSIATCSSSATLAAWQSSSGKDLNSSSGSANLVSVQTGANTGLSDLRLQSTSDAIGASLVLNTSTFPGADFDADGNYRGAVGDPCDAGAFFYVAPYIVQEDGEGTGTPAGWSDSGTVNWDYTASVYAGAQALSLPNSATVSSTSYAVSSSSNLYASFWFRGTGTPSANKTVMGFFNGATALGSVVIDDSDWELFHGGINQLTTGDQQTSSVWYKVWLEYEAGTGANGVARFYFSSTGTKPGSPNLSIATGTGTLPVTSLTLGGVNFNGGMIFDDIVVSLSPIP